MSSKDVPPDYDEAVHVLGQPSLDLSSHLNPPPPYPSPSLSAPLLLTTSTHTSHLNPQKQEKAAVISGFPLPADEKSDKDVEKPVSRSKLCHFSLLAFVREL